MTDMAAKNQHLNLVSIGSSSNWIAELAKKFDKTEERKIKKEFDDAMAGYSRLKLRFIDVAKQLSDSTLSTKISLYTFPEGFTLEKYASILRNERPSKTGMFTLQFQIESEPQVAFQFFFTGPSKAMTDSAVETPFSLVLARLEDSEQKLFVRLDSIEKSNVPTMFEIAFDPKKGRYFFRTVRDQIREVSIETLTRTLFEDIYQKHFQGK